MIKALLTTLLILAGAVSVEVAPQVIAGEVLAGANCAVTITSPTSASSYDAGSASTIDLAGTAVSDAPIHSITWSNSLTGGSGSASGTNSWSISAAALSAGSNAFTVTCTTVTGTVGTDSIAVTRSGSGITVGDWTFPSTDFTPYFTTSRLATVQTTYNASPASFPDETGGGSVSPGRPQYWGMRYQISGVCGASDGGYASPQFVGSCGDAVNYLVYAATNSLDFFCSTNSGTVCADNQRWAGEISMHAFAWTWDQHSAADKDLICTSMARNVAMKLARGWGSVYSPGNNYDWGYMRNLYWAMTILVKAHINGVDCTVPAPCSWPAGDGISGTYQEPSDICGMGSLEIAEYFAARFEDRWDVFVEYLNDQMVGGCGSEGNQYGWYMHDYLMPVMISASDYGRNLYSEVQNYWQQAGWMAIYTASNVTMYGLQPGSNQFGFTQPFIQDFSYGQTQFYGVRASGSIEQGNFMTALTILESGTTLGNMVQYWLANNSPYISKYLKATNTNHAGAGTAFSTLPLDYYAPGCGILIVKDSWSRVVANKPTDFFIQLQQVNNGGGNHTQCDAGSYQGRRGQRWAAKESSDYGGWVTNIAGTGVTTTDAGVAQGGTFGQHNGRTLGTEDSNGYCLNYDGVMYIEAESGGNPTTTRLHRSSDFVFGATNLEPWFSNNLGPEASSLVSAYAEYLYLRNFDVLCQYDRITTTTTGKVVTSFEHFLTSPTNPSSNVYAGENNGEFLRVYAPVMSGYTRAYTIINEDTFGNTPGALGDAQYRLQIETSGTTLKEIPICRNLYSTADTPATVAWFETPTTFSMTITKDGNTAVWDIVRGATSTGGTVTINGGAATTLRETVDTITADENGVSWP